MANTQTTVPIFVAAQVLEAAQLNNSAATGVPVFATTVTRDAGFGGAGEKPLAEGQLCYLESTNVVQYYDGAAWATVGPAPAASSALTLITNQSFTGATTTIANVFSATYENYLVKASNVVSSSGVPRFRFRFGAGTSHNFNSIYYNPPSTGSVDTSGTAGNFISFAIIKTSASNEQLNLSADIMSPFLTKPTGLNGFSVGGDLYTTLTTAVETSSTSFTDLVLSNSTAVSMSGQIQVYGYSLS